MPSSSSNPALNIIGIILCGGRGQRSGGADKPLLSWQGRPLISQVIERLAPQVSDIVISANRNQDRYLSVAQDQLQRQERTRQEQGNQKPKDAYSGMVEVVADKLPGYAGPLAGVQAAMAKDRWCFVCPGDAPELPMDLVARLWQHRQGDKPVVVHDGTRQQHLHFLLPPTQQNALASYLAIGNRSAYGLHEALESVAVHCPDSKGFQNFNRLVPG